MKMYRMLRKRRHPARQFVSDHAMLLTGIAGSAALAFAVNRMRGRARPRFVDRAVDKSRDLRERVRGLAGRGRDDVADEQLPVEEPAISRANGARNHVELSTR